MLTEVEIEVACQMREHIGGFSNCICERMNGHEPNNVEIACYLGYWGQYNILSWINLGDQFIVDELSRRGFQLVELDNANRYHQVTAKVVGICRGGNRLG